MKPDLPPVSPLSYHPTIFETPLESRLKLPDGRMAGQVSSDLAVLDDYCQSQFNKTWSFLRCEALQDLATRVEAINGRISALEDLLRKGQSAETLVEVYDDLYEALAAAYADGSLNALIGIGKLCLTIGAPFPPLGSSEKGVEAVKMAAELGNIAAYCFLGDFFLKEGRVQEAAAAYQSGVEEGCSACAYQLGQFAERGVGGVVKNDRAALDYYFRAARDNYPPAQVALARLWLKRSELFPMPANLVEMLKDCIEMRCESAEMTLAGFYLRPDSSPDAKGTVLSLYRCAAVDGDVEAQLKLASLLAGNGTAEVDVQPDAEEAARWYRRICGDDNATLIQQAMAHLELAHLLMKQGKYDKAVLHYFGASHLYPEAVELQNACERRVEARYQTQERRNAE